MVMKFCGWIDLIKWGAHCTGTDTLACLIMPPSKKWGYIALHLSVCRLVRRPHFFPEHNSKSISGIIFTPHRYIDLIKEKCSAQVP